MIQSNCSMIFLEKRKEKKKEKDSKALLEGLTVETSIGYLISKC